MSIRCGLHLILCLSLILTPVTPVHASDGLELATAENAFLRDLAKRTKLFIHMNWASINGTYMCLTDRSADQIQCQVRLNHVRSEIALNYPKLRQHQILFHLFDYSNFSMLLLMLSSAVNQKTASQPVTMSLRWDDLNLEHPMDYAFHSEDLPKTPWNTAEIESGLNGLVTHGQADLRGFNHYFHKLCADVFQRQGEKDTVASYLSLCEKIDLKYDGQKGALYFSLPNTMPNGSRQAFNEFRTFGADPSIALAKSFRAKFLGMVQIVPYVGLVKSSSPDQTDLAHAFKMMLAPARKMITEFDERAVLYSTGTPPRDRSSAARWKWLNLMGYKPIAKHLTAYPGPLMDAMPSYSFEELREELDSEYETNQLVKMGGQLALILAANVAVCWSGPRLLGMITRAARLIPGFKGLCYPMVTIPINIGYMIESMHDFSVKYQEVFASQSGQQLLREIETLDSDETFVVMAALMMPLGTGKALTYLGAKSLKLSKGSLEYLKQAIAKAQVRP